MMLVFLTVSNLIPKAREADKQTPGKLDVAFLLLTLGSFGLLGAVFALLWVLPSRLFQGAS